MRPPEAPSAPAAPGNNTAGEHCVIIGAGHAAAQLCASLRQAGYEGGVTLIGDEPFVPYHRPPLSKAQLDPNASDPVQPIRPQAFYEDNDISLRLGERVSSIDRQAKRVTLQSGGTLSYTALVLATGSTHRRPPVPGIDHERVHVLQTAAHADQVRDRIASAKSVVVIGAGFIGLEAAASLRKHGVGVTVLELADRVLSRVTCPEVSAYFEALHRRQGVDLRTGVMAQGVEETEGGKIVVKTDADGFAADFVIVGAGAAANDQLAAQAGLEVGNGVVVNEFNQTVDPSIYAIGDCCNQLNPIYGVPMRLESVQNATDQAKTAALSIAGQPKAHSALPWFWSDQYDVKFQIAGVSTGYDRVVVRGSATPGEPCSVWYVRDTEQGPRLLAVDALNEPRAYMVAQKIIPTGGCPDLDLVADPNAEPKAILQSAKR